jgi:hypothetical protein
MPKWAFFNLIPSFTPRQAVVGRAGIKGSNQYKN